MPSLRTMLWLIVVGLTAVEARAQSSDRPESVGQPVQLQLEPGRFPLVGKRAQQQLVLTGKYAGEELRDLTGVAKFESSDPNVVRIDGMIVRPVGDGAAKITAVVGPLTAVVEVQVSKMGDPAPISFKNETQMALTKSSCNMGACHGSPSGKGGFRLSLRAYDPDLDIMTLRSEFFGRRVNPMNPSESLLLKKPLMEVSHAGGKRIKKGDAAYQVLENWIAEGLRVDSPTEPDLVKLEPIPAVRILKAPADRQQIAVMGHFSDGSVRDLTALTDFTSSAEAVASVNADGLATKMGRGEAVILMRYLDKTAVTPVTFLEDVPGFAWTNPPEHNFVDALVFQKQLQMQILPSELCTDDEFLRRSYLDLTGRLPTLTETQTFLADVSPSKRSALIDQLLDSEDFASYWSLKWADVLRSNSKKLKVAGVHKFKRWIYESVRDDKPFDQFAKELLTAQGSVFENPAANYWRASRDPQDAVETTSQLFLGVRIQCAKCHNHPFERWTQDNYYGIAAAFTRVGRKNTADPEDEVIFVQNAGEVTQPRTGKQMKVHLLLQGDVDVAADQDRRVVFAEWLTKPDNPFFARSLVNRMWGHLMGRGLVEPVDDFRDSNPASNGPLLEELARQFAANHFSQKWAIRTIMNSRTYQLSSRKNDFNKQDELYNSHATTRLLTAEQLLDAICEVTDIPEQFPGMPVGTRASELADPPTDNYFLKVFGQPQREMACQCERSTDSNLSQALQMINGPVVHNKLRADNGRIAKMIGEQKSDDDIITTLYLAALSRPPVAEELTAAKQHIAGSTDRRQALEDVGWAVLNSKEFLFQH
ncbi:DUF1549 and DUF1553 domain-containing protein [Planctellipticum variicoloris]|uniref:DUF1549 and DUF1553 domain-containing protein n=1 Tax=Planctellipticum variicoloris TaxID=3064265 RepID=UPI0030138D14|nr:DUF1549 and DUF1553 domain-containing protein [Planctomycetaceae bacterium SH412]